MSDAKRVSKERLTYRATGIIKKSISVVGISA